MEKDLKESLERLTYYENKLASLKWTFWRGIFYGFGFFVGSVVLAALFIYILSLFDTAPIIGEYVSKILNAARNSISR